jgi:hypothetical protein
MTLSPKAKLFNSHSRQDVQEILIHILEDGCHIQAESDLLSCNHQEGYIFSGHSIRYLSKCNTTSLP